MTIIVIAHRLSTITNATRSLCWMAAVTEIGTYSQLGQLWDVLQAVAGAERLQGGMLC